MPEGKGTYGSKVGRPPQNKGSLLNNDRQQYIFGGPVSRLITKLFKKHKGDAAVKSDIYLIKSKLEDVDNEISSFTKQEVDNSSSIREVVDELEGNKDDLVSALKQIDEEGVPLNYDETGFPTSERVVGETDESFDDFTKRKRQIELKRLRQIEKSPQKIANKKRIDELVESRKLTEAEKNILREELPKRKPSVYTDEQSKGWIGRATADDIIEEYEAGHDIIIYSGDPPDTPPDLGMNAYEIDEILGKKRTKKAEGGTTEDQMNALAISVAPARVEEQETHIMPDGTEMAGATHGEYEQMHPDEEMEEDYVDYIVESALEEEDQNYLESALMKDAKLSEIFDQVVESASEFSGSGPIEGPGSEVSDSIPARLSDGEFVFTAKATDEIGADVLQQQMEAAEAGADQRQGVVHGGMVEDEGDPKAVPIQTRGSIAAQGNVPNVAKQSRQVEEEMLKSSPRRYYVPVSG